MPKTLSWNNPLLPNKVKQQLVQHSLCQYDNSASIDMDIGIAMPVSMSISLRSRLRNWMCSKFMPDEYQLMNYYLQSTGQRKKTSRLAQFKQSVINEMPLERKYKALTNLIKWGFDAHFNYINNGHRPMSENNDLLSHEVIYNYIHGYTYEDDAKQMLSVVFNASQTLASREEQHRNLFFPEELINFFNQVFNKTPQVCPLHYASGTDKLLETEYGLSAVTKKIKSLNAQMFAMITTLNSSMYSFLMNEEGLGNQEKSMAEYMLFKKHCYQYQTLSYNKNSHRSVVSNLFDEKAASLMKLQNIISRDWVFSNKVMGYHILKEVFASEELMDELSHHTIFKCYQEFENLDESLKKSLTAELLLKRREEVIFNLLAHGLNLNWIIKLRDKENVVALEVLSSIPMIKMVLSSQSFNLKTCNQKGENILHLLGTLPLMDDEIRNLLDNRLESLTEFERNNLFYQTTSHNLTPLMKAIEYKEEIMVEYLLDWNLDVWETIPNEKPFRSVMEFLDSGLLGQNHQAVLQEFALALNINVDYENKEYHEYYCHLSKKWNSEHNYHYLNDVLPENKLEEEEKIHKI
jgi:hypothetical protein